MVALRGAGGHGCARKPRRPVKLVLERPQMFGPVGGRPRTEQRVVLGAQTDGTLTVMRHEVMACTSFIEDWLEPCALVTRMLYAVREPAD
ncbi:molybdopterin cofactor-binding domain-containing protein [Cupriavidus basilensis]